MTQVEAHSFASPLDFKTMQERLNARCAFRWELGDNETYGELLSARPFGDRTQLRIVKQNGRCAIDIVFRSDEPGAEQSWINLQALVHDDLLSLLSAADVRPAMNLD